MHQDLVTLLNMSTPLCYNTRYKKTKNYVADHGLPQWFDEQTHYLETKVEQLRRCSITGSSSNEAGTSDGCDVEAETNIFYPTSNCKNGCKSLSYEKGEHRMTTLLVFSNAVDKSENSLSCLTESWTSIYITVTK